MTTVLPADMTDTHEEDRKTFHIRRASIMFESRTLDDCCRSR